MLKACDHAERLTQPLIDTLKSLGYVASGRYTKSLTATEVALAKNNNYGIFIYAEGMGNAATFMQGYNRGATDGMTAKTACAAISVPKEIPVSFAVDYDADSPDVANILAYAAGFFAYSGYAPGIYCDGAVAAMEPAGVKIILAGAGGWPGTADFLKSGKAAAVQHPPITIAGIEIDPVDIYDESLVWYPGGKTQVTETNFLVKSVSDLQSYLAAAGFNPGAIDNTRGPNTQAALLAWYNSL